MSTIFIVGIVDHYEYEVRVFDVPLEHVRGFRGLVEHFGDPIAELASELTIDDGVVVRQPIVSWTNITTYGSGIEPCASDTFTQDVVDCAKVALTETISREAGSTFALRCEKVLAAWERVTIRPEESST